MLTKAKSAQGIHARPECPLPRDERQPWWSEGCRCLRPTAEGPSWPNTASDAPAQRVTGASAHLPRDALASAATMMPPTHTPQTRRARVALHAPAHGEQEAGAKRKAAAMSAALRRFGFWEQVSRFEASGYKARRNTTARSRCISCPDMYRALGSSQRSNMPRVRWR